MSEGLKILKGGKLQKTEWNSDIRAYETKDVTDRAIQSMFDYCDLEEGVTLKDIFLLLNSELEIFDAMIGNWCKEIVTEGLTKTEKPYTGEYDADGIEYLELYWDFWANNGKEPEFRGHAFPSFHATGFELKEDRLFDWKNADGTPAVEWPKGHRIPWSLSFSKSNELINLPLKLQSEVSVYNDDVDDRINWHHVLTAFKGATYTLGHILYGIIWELSFHGGPEARDEAGDELKEIAKEIKEKTNE